MLAEEWGAAPGELFEAAIRRCRKSSLEEEPLPRLSPRDSLANGRPPRAGEVLPGRSQLRRRPEEIGWDGNTGGGAGHGAGLGLLLLSGCFWAGRGVSGLEMPLPSVGSMGSF